MFPSSETSYKHYFTVFKLTATSEINTSYCEKQPSTARCLEPNGNVPRIVIF